MNAPLQRDWPRALAYAVLVLGGWAAANALIAIGVLFTAFVMFANGTATGFFAEASNLARHFEAAASGQRASFIHLTQIAALVVFLTVCGFRARSLAGLKETLRRRPQQID